MNRIAAMVAAGVAGVIAGTAAGQNTYVDTILVANDASYNPLRLVDPLIGNGWGVTLRPPGAGGHFWISNASTGTTTTYVGDVHGPNGFVPLFQDELKFVNIPIGKAVLPDVNRPATDISIPTGQVFNHSSTDFVVSAEGVTAAAKFIFVTGDGTISGWTEVKNPDATMRRQTKSVIMVDNSHLYDDERLRYTGCAVTEEPSGNRLYVCDWTGEKVIAFDHLWNEIPIATDKFHLPSPGEIWRPWNIQYFRSGPNAQGRLWVTFNKAEDPWEEYPEFGAVAEFDLDGNFIRGLTDTLSDDPLANSDLRDPWGLAIAPANFGPFSGMMLVANFGDGTIPAFDLKTGKFVDFVRDANGEPIVVDGIWGITFGNGVALGDANALYYAAGPNIEQDGAFGTIRFIPDTCPKIQGQPASVRASAGDPAMLRVSAPSPVRCKYQWQVRRGAQWENAVDAELPGLGALSGTASEALSVVTAPGAAAEFRVVVSNAGGSVTSDVASLTSAGLELDVTGDGAIDGHDVAGFVDAWFNARERGTLGADWNADAVLDSDDLREYVRSWRARAGPERK